MTPARRRHLILLPAVLWLALGWPVAATAMTLYVHAKDQLGLAVAQALAPELAKNAGIPTPAVRIVDNLTDLAGRLDSDPKALVLSGQSLSTNHTKPWFERTLGIVHRRDFMVEQPSNQRLAIVNDQSESMQLRRNFPGVTWIAYRHIQTALKEMATGVTDGVVGPLAELTDEVIRWQLNGMQFSPWVVSTPVVIHHRLNSDLSLRLERAVALTAPRADQLVGKSLLFVSDQPNETTFNMGSFNIGTLIAVSIAGTLLVVGVCLVIFRSKAASTLPTASTHSPKPAPVAPPQSTVGPRGPDDQERSQQYLNEVNQRLQSEILARQAKEAELMRVQKELSAAQDRLQQQVRTDPLTRIANRRYFDEVLAKEWRRHARERVEMAIVLLDIDHFKLYNDTLGHPAGDECLRKIAALLTQSFARGGDLVARYGGEEFVVLLPNTPTDEAIAQVERLQSELSAVAIPHPASPTAHHVTISMGVASCIPIADDDPWGLIEEADTALYDAKTQGRNGFRVAAA